MFDFDEMLAQLFWLCVAIARKYKKFKNMPPAYVAGQLNAARRPDNKRPRAGRLGKQLILGPARQPAALVSMGSPGAAVGPLGGGHLLAPRF